MPTQQNMRKPPPFMVSLDAAHCCTAMSLASSVMVLLVIDLEELWHCNIHNATSSQSTDIWRQAPILNVSTFTVMHLLALCNFGKPIFGSLQLLLLVQPSPCESGRLS